MATDVMPDLDDTRRDSGWKLLELTDEVGFDACAAMWMRAPDSLRWHYILGTPMVDTRGPAWVFDRLLQVFRKLHLPPGISPLDIYVLSPLDSRIRDLGIQVGGSRNGLEVQNYSFNDRHILHAVIYRWRHDGARDPSLRFDNRVKQLLAA